MVKKSEVYYPQWVKKNPIGFLVQREVEKLFTIDQTRIYFYPMLYNNSELSDSMTINIIQKELDKLDYSNILAISSLAHKYGLPNNFDHGYNTYYRVTLLMLHSMSQEMNIKRVWVVLFTFLEQAYFDGKISYTFFYHYDKCLLKAIGYQYYGTMNDDVPNIDPENLKERKNKYSL